MCPDSQDNLCVGHVDTRIELSTRPIPVTGLGLLHFIFEVHTKLTIWVLVGRGNDVLKKDLRYRRQWLVALSPSALPSRRFVFQA